MKDFLLGVLITYIILREREVRSKIERVKEKAKKLVEKRKVQEKTEEVLQALKKPVDIRTIGLKTPGFTLPAWREKGQFKEEK